MNKVNRTYGLSLLWLLLLGACGNTPDEHQDKDKPVAITIAVAANMQFAMEALTETFTQMSGIRCETAISSSGKLTAQIKEGAPFDLFISADMKYPREIFKSGLAVASPKVYAYGKLVLWSMKEGINPTLDLLPDDQIRHIAIANPKVAPYGVAAVETLKNHQLLDKVADKLVYGESIAQTNQFIITGSTEAGFTAMSVVLSPQMEGKGKWIAIGEADYPPIEQGVVVIKREDGPMAEAEKFYDFLASEEARAILESFGYGVDDNM
ncbi:MAG: molybdate ABC transporter substrate-binding protein [Saprospiraceae bacterium]|nr:molybdate ABC transporter substrate-binding protein [Lewinella sp.]